MAPENTATPKSHKNPVKENEEVSHSLLCLYCHTALTQTMHLCFLESLVPHLYLEKKNVSFSNSEEYAGVPLNAAFVYVAVRTLNCSRTSPLTLPPLGLV